MTDDDNARHDFKNQLAIIQGFAEILLSEAAADDPHRRDLEEIQKAALTALSRLAQIFPEPG
jgi:signal transduction histidine kinase